MNFIKSEFFKTSEQKDIKKKSCLFDIEGVVAQFQKGYMV